MQQKINSANNKKYTNERISISIESLVLRWNNLVFKIHSWIDYLDDAALLSIIALKFIE